MNRSDAPFPTAALALMPWFAGPAMLGAWLELMAGQRVGARTPPAPHDLDVPHALEAAAEPELFA